MGHAAKRQAPTPTSYNEFHLRCVLSSFVLVGRYVEDYSSL